MATDIYVYNGALTTLQRGPGDITAIPPESSLFAEPVWATMCTEAGGEGMLITELGARDMREVVHA